MKEILKVSDVNYSYNGKKALDNIGFNIESGNFIGIIGPNGAGKSTLLKVLSSALKPDRGTVLLNGIPLSNMKSRDIASCIAFVPEETIVNFCFTCREIVLMGRTPYINRFSWEKDEDYMIAEEAMKMTDTIEFKSRDINSLSSGEKQRVIIARALAQKPDVLLLDEPTSHLDINHQKEIFDLLMKLNRDSNLTIVTVMHDINLASIYCENLILLDSGKVFMEGKPSELITEENIKSIYGTEVRISRDVKTGIPGITIIPENK